MRGVQAVSGSCQLDLTITQEVEVGEWGVEEVVNTYLIEVLRELNE